MLVITEWYKFRLNVRKIKLPASDAFRFKMIFAEISANQDKIKIKSRSFKISPILSGVFLRHGRSALIKLCKSQVGQIKAMIGCFVQAVFSVQPFSALFLFRDLASHCILSTLCLRIRGL